MEDEKSDHYEFIFSSLRLYFTLFFKYCVFVMSTLYDGLKVGEELLFGIQDPSVIRSESFQKLGYPERPKPDKDSKI